ncbi:SIR2 family NAD-dependent protein deacylase [Rhodotorula paludigena]|uniref:SIR2 family NAD-dependent protein deacylase n=1 Tax=Rhodotorula paludigena TaxID=86838 RepID=UPI003170136A
MGSPSSSPAANRAFPHLAADERPSLKDVAKLIKDGKAKRIMVMAGAGISTAAGIPDFRSPGTGLYDNLAKYDLPYPEAIFDIDYLEERPEAFYTLAKELYPGNFKPTICHYFFRLLQEKSLLAGAWTQNIDTLERIAGIRDDLIVEAHGSFAEAACLNCRKKYTKEEIKPQIMRGEVVRCQENRCKGKDAALIKPNIVFFGEGLPDRFFSRLSHFSSCDLLIVLGTSLTVGPFNSLMHRVPSSCPRLLINLESVGEVDGPRSREGFDFDGVTGRAGGIRDVRRLGDADEGVLELCEMLGWADELRRLKDEGWKALDEAEGKTTPAEVEQRKEEDKEAKREEIVEHVGEAAGGVKVGTEDVDDLTKAVEGVSLEQKNPVDDKKAPL